MANEAAVQAGLLGLAEPAAAGRRLHAIAADRVLRAEEFQFLVLLRLAGAVGAGHAARHGHLPGHVLQGRREHRIRLGRIHHARGRLRLAAALPAFDRRLRVLPGDLPAHVPRHHVRLVQGAARTAVAVRHDHLSGADGRGLHGLRAALGQHVVLGRHGDHQSIRRHTGHRPGAGRVDPRRLRHRRCHAEPLLLAARRGAAAAAAAAGGAAPGGAARGGVQQSGRRRDQGEEERPGHTARRHTVSSLLHRQGHLRCLRCS